ncbi:PREDICTED: uncharacterized protein LOC106109490 [Papilio polytes]|uniref:uncharacterized protein LOC106109490 n=1 Tax=Papilio polytes TaxID=76194 RepID=UPI0006762104|nr:PREDICTED: uncharacterized protein LOC106109490 [Papilio polytes]
MDRLDLAKSSKFTRGEKCIFIHLILTFVLIILSIVIYFVHLCLINHPGNSYLNTRRSVAVREVFKEVTTPDYLPIGVLYLSTNPIRAVCNTILFREKWSIAPAHCVIIRSDPSLVQLLPKWGIKFRTSDLKIIVTKIRRSIAHPHFNRDDFSNNIGLLEHTVSVPIHQYISKYQYNIVLFNLIPKF